MGINYKAPGVPSLAGYFSGGGGGHGGGGGFQYAPQQFDPREAYAREQQIQLQGNIESGQIAQRISGQGALQQQAADLDAWQYHQKVTEQEAAQLRQDQNSIAAIDADPTMSAVEKMQAKTRIKTRIDWTSERQHRDLQQAQVTMFQARAEEYKQQASLDEERIRNSTALATGKVKTMIRPASAELVRKIVSDSGINPDSPDGIKEMDKVGAEMNLVDTFAINEKGAIVGKPIWTGGQFPEGSVPAGATPGARSSTGRQQDPEASAGMHHDKAFAAAMKAESEGKSFDETYKRYMDKLKETQGEVMTPEKKKAKEKEVQQTAMFQADERVKEVAAMPMASPAEKSEATRMLNEMKRLTKEYPPGAIPPRIDRRLTELDDQYKAFQQIIAGRANKQPGQQQPQPAAQQQAQPAPDQTRTDRPTDSSVTPAQAVGNAARNLVDIIKESAPRDMGGKTKRLLDSLGPYVESAHPSSWFK